MIDRKQKVIFRKTGELIPYINNAKEHPEQQIQQIAASIKEFGFTVPILIDETGMILAGHGRLAAAHLLKLDEVPCIEAKHLTGTQKKAYIIADNKLAMNTGFDDALLKIDLDELQELNFDLSILGFADEELEGLIDPVFEDQFDAEKEDEVPEVPEVPIVKLGDVVEMGKHRLICGDSTNKDTVDKLMDGNKVDMVFTDPPYGMSLDTDFSSMKSKFEGTISGNKYENVKGDHKDFKLELITTIFENFGYCEEVFLWGGDYYSDVIIEKNNGSWFVWDKRGDDSADKMFGSCFELCWSKKKHKRDIIRIKWAGIFGMEKEHDKKRKHPTQKPVALILWFFEKFKGENIVDLYGGSGSTLLAAEKTNKKTFLMELDPKYCDVIIQRWCEYTGINEIKINDKKVNWIEQTKF